MASIRRELVLEARPIDVWAAVREGALRERLVPGLVVDTRLENGVRIVTFANGLVARELIVDIDDDARRLVWAATPQCRFSTPAKVGVASSGSPICCPTRPRMISACSSTGLWRSSSKRWSSV